MQGAGDSKKLAFAQVLRGFAALLVVLCHFADAGLEALIELASRDVPVATGALASAQAAPAAATPIKLFPPGQAGVAIFFLISGFVIPFAFQRQTRLGFLAGRFFRIWPTYAAGFTIGLAVLGLVYGLDGEPIPYSLTEMLAHYSLLIRDVGGFANIDLIVWTLEVEVRFYLFCIVIAPWLRAADAGRLMAAGLLVAFSSFAFGEIGASVSTASPWYRIAGVIEGSGELIAFMMIGIIFHLRFIGAVTTLQAYALGAIFFGLFALLAAHGGNVHHFPATVGNYATALAVFTIAYAFRDRFVGTGLLGMLGTISYSLYVIHPLLGFWIIFTLTTAGLPLLLSFAVALAVVLASAWMLYIAVERPSHLFGRRLSAKIGRGPLPAIIDAPAKA